MASRTYRSPARERAAERTRERIVEAAGEVLRKQGAGGFSLETVAQAAGVSRLTVYKRLGSRHALLEAVFDAQAARGGLHRVREAMAGDDPRAAMLQVVAIFCDFWSADRATLAGLHEACAGDAECADALRARNERRRRVLARLAARGVERGEIRSEAARDLVDLLFVLTGMPVFAQLTEGDRRPATARALLEAAAADAIQRAAGDR